MRAGLVGIVAGTEQVVLQMTAKGGIKNKTGMAKARHHRHKDECPYNRYINGWGKVFPLQPTRGSGEHHKLPSRVWGTAPAASELYAFYLLFRAF